MNVLFPIAGPKLVFKDALQNVWCKPIIDINGKPLIEYIFSNIYPSLTEVNNYVFVINETDSLAFSLDYVIKLLHPAVKIVKAHGLTKGALCSCLLAIEYIDVEDELLIINGDQVVEYPLMDTIYYFRKNNADGGILTFESIHPKWSYVKVDENGYIIETSEKKPISRNATVGIYYFKKGRYFIDGAKEVLRKEVMINDAFYVSSVYNELILKNKRILEYKIPNDKFFPLDTPEAIEMFSSYIKNKTHARKVRDENATRY